jgi:hypothetical protein
LEESGSAQSGNSTPGGECGGGWRSCTQYRSNCNIVNIHQTQSLEIDIKYSPSNIAIEHRYTFFMLSSAYNFPKLGCKAVNVRRYPLPYQAISSRVPNSVVMLGIAVPIIVVSKARRNVSKNVEPMMMGNAHLCKADDCELRGA